MNRFNSCLFAVVAITAAFCCLLAEANAPGATPFSNDVKALPFPPDAKEMELDAAFEDIAFVSRSPLAALGAFYRRQMTARGWKEDTAESSIQDDEIELTFQHGSSKVTIEMDEDSDGEVDVSLDCEGLTWDSANDPVALAKAGVPQLQSHLFLQREFPRPKGATDIEYEDDECEFKCPLEFAPAAKYFAGALGKLGWREDQSDRFLGKYIHERTYRRGPVTLEVSANKNHQGSGSRISVEYTSTEKEPGVPPLAPLGQIAGQTMAPGTQDPAASASQTAPKPEKIVNVANNKGSATVTLGTEKFVLGQVAAYQTRPDSGERTMLVFSQKPIPLQKMQQLLATEEDFSFGDLFEFDLPAYIELELSERYVSFSFSASSTSISSSVDSVARDIEHADGRVRGTIEMTEAKEVFDKPFLFEVTIDAGLMRSDTRLASMTGASPPAMEADSALSDEHGLPLPHAASDIQSRRSRYRRQVDATIKRNLSEIVAIYRYELPDRQWPEVKAATKVAADSATLVFRNPDGPLTIRLAQTGSKTTIKLVTQDDVAARRDGVLPEPGKARLILGNAHTKDIVIAIGESDYPVESGRGAKDPKTAINYTIPPGKYTFTIKIPGEAPQTETLDIAAGTAWGVLGLPTGGYFAQQLY